MATSNGIVRFSGQLGDLIFYRRNEKDVVRSKPGTYQLSENSKKSAKDFGEASSNAAHIRKAFAAMVKDYGYGDLTSRLTKRITAIFKSIPATHSGNKKMIDGDIGLLAGFEFNAATTFESLFLKRIETSVEADGLVKLILPKTDLVHLVKLIPNAEEAVLQVRLFNFDLQGGDYETIEIDDFVIPLENLSFKAVKLSIPTIQKGDKALLIATGISYLNEGNRSADRRFYACKIDYAAHLRDGVVVEFAGNFKEKIEVAKKEMGLRWEVEE